MFKWPTPVPANKLGYKITLKFDPMVNFLIMDWYNQFKGEMSYSALVNHFVRSALGAPKEGGRKRNRDSRKLMETSIVDFVGDKYPSPAPQDIFLHGDTVRAILWYIAAAETFQVYPSVGYIVKHALAALCRAPAPSFRNMPVTRQPQRAEIDRIKAAIQHEPLKRFLALLQQNNATLNNIGLTEWVKNLETRA